MSIVPTFLASLSDCPTGIEAAKPTDLIFPRLVVMQSNSPAVQEGKFVAGDIVRKDTAQVYIPKGSSGRVVPICFQREFVHWAPRSSGQGVIARSRDEHSEIARRAAAQLDAAVRLKKYVTVDEESFVESHSWLLANDSELFVVSFSKGSLMESKRLISFISSARVPAYALQFVLQSTLRKNVRGAYFVPEIAPHPTRFVQNEAEFRQYKELCARLKDSAFGALQDEEIEVSVSSEV